ncbi:MAG: NAD(P)H-dependent oxidoreductase [Spirochaetes bacterium]|nr:NAD(P)H-dependent oxidoreductase [Spirochaetota bacterium]
MKILIIYSHPWEGSYNYAILQNLIKGLKKSGFSYDLIDLNKDKFDPVFKKQELALYNKGGYLDPKIKKYQEKIKNSNHLIFLFPTWWGFTPAILKGFIDKVFLKKWAYFIGPGYKVEKYLTFIKNATIITTMNCPFIFYHLFLKPAYKFLFGTNFLKLCGIKKLKFLILNGINEISKSKREKFLKKVKKYGERIANIIYK